MKVLGGISMLRFSFLKNLLMKSRFARRGFVAISGLKTKDTIKLDDPEFGKLLSTILQRIDIDICKKCDFSIFKHFYCTCINSVALTFYSGPAAVNN